MSESIDDLSRRVDILAGMIDSAARRLDATDRHVLDIEDAVTRLGERPDRWADDPLGGTPLHDMLTTDLGPPRDLVIGAYSPEPRPVDPQSAAFRDSTEADWTSDADIATMREQAS